MNDKSLSEYTKEEIATLQRRMEEGEAELYYAWKKGKEIGHREGFQEGMEKIRDALISEWENDGTRCGIIILIAEKLLAEHKEKAT